MTTNPASRSSPLSSWLESAGPAANRPQSRTSDSESFASAFAGGAGFEEPRSAPQSSGLTPFASRPGSGLPGLIPAQAEFQSGTAAPHCQPPTQGAEQSASTAQTTTVWGPEGYPFQDVEDSQIEPDNAILLWRRPDELPSLAREAKLALAEALRKAGLNPREFAVSYWETLGENPWGRQVIPELTVVLPNGRKVDVSATWTRETPEAALEDIRRAMAAPPISEVDS